MRLGISVLGAALLLTTSLAAPASASPDRPEVSMAVRHDVSPAFRGLAAIPRRIAAQPNREIENRVPLDMAQRGKPNTGGPDPVVQQSAPTDPATPTPTLSFDGISDDDNAAILGGRVVPPDTNGDVGTASFVQVVNLMLAVYRKSDGVRTWKIVAGEP